MPPSVWQLPQCWDASGAMSSCQFGRAAAGSSPVVGVGSLVAVSVALPAVPTVPSLATVAVSVSSLPSSPQAGTRRAVHNTGKSRPTRVMPAPQQVPGQAKPGPKWGQAAACAGSAADHGLLSMDRGPARATGPRG